MARARGPLRLSRSDWPTASLAACFEDGLTPETGAKAKLPGRMTAESRQQAPLDNHRAIRAILTRTATGAHNGEAGEQQPMKSEAGELAA